MTYIEMVRALTEGLTGETSTKGEQIMAKQPEQLLPKDLLADLSEGDRSDEWLEVSAADVRSDTLGAALRQGNTLSEMFQQSSGSSFASSNLMQQYQNINPSLTNVAGQMIRFK